MKRDVTWVEDKSGPIRTDVGKLKNRDIDKNMSGKRVRNQVKGISYAFCWNGDVYQRTYLEVVIGRYI